MGISVCITKVAKMIFVRLLDPPLIALLEVLRTFFLDAVDLTYRSPIFKRDVGNPIHNIYRKTAAAVFSASNGPTRFTMLFLTF